MTRAPRRRRHDVVVLELSSNVDPKPLSATERAELAKRAADMARAIKSRVASSPISHRPLVDVEADCLIAEAVRERQQKNATKGVQTKREERAPADEALLTAYRNLRTTDPALSEHALAKKLAPRFSNPGLKNPIEALRKRLRRLAKR